MPKLEVANASNLFDQIFNGLIKSIKKNDANTLAAALKRYEQFGSDEYKTRLVEEGSDTTGQSLLAFALKNKAFHCFALLRDKGCTCSPAVIKAILADSSEKQATIEAAIEQGHYDIAALFIGRPHQLTNCVVNDDEQESDITGKIATRLNELSKSGEQYQKRLQAMPEVSLYALLQNDTAKMMHDELPSHLTTPIMIDQYPESFVHLVNHEVHGEHVCASLYRKWCGQLGTWANRDALRTKHLDRGCISTFTDIVADYNDIINDSINLQSRMMALALTIDGAGYSYSSALRESTDKNITWQSEAHIENIMCTAALYGYSNTFSELYMMVDENNRIIFSWHENGVLAKAIKILLNNNDYEMLNQLLGQNVYHCESICKRLTVDSEKHRSNEYNNVVNYIVQILGDTSPSKTLAILLYIYYDELYWSDKNCTNAFYDLLKEVILQQVHRLNTDEELIQQVCEKLSSNVESQLVDEKGNTFLHYAGMYNMWTLLQAYNTYATQYHATLDLHKNTEDKSPLDYYVHTLPKIVLQYPIEYYEDRYIDESRLEVALQYIMRVYSDIFDRTSSAVMTDDDRTLRRYLQAGYCYTLEKTAINAASIASFIKNDAIHDPQIFDKVLTAVASKGMVIRDLNEVLDHIIMLLQHVSQMHNGHQYIINFITAIVIMNVLHAPFELEGDYIVGEYCNSSLPRKYEFSQLRYIFNVIIGVDEELRHKIIAVLSDYIFKTTEDDEAHIRHQPNISTTRFRLIRNALVAGEFTLLNKLLQAASEITDLREVIKEHFNYSIMYPVKKLIADFQLSKNSEDNIANSASEFIALLHTLHDKLGYKLNVYILERALSSSPKSNDFVFDDPNTVKLVKHMLETGQGMEYIEGDIAENYGIICSIYLRYGDFAEAQSFFNSIIKNNKISNVTDILDEVIRALFIGPRSIFKWQRIWRSQNTIQNVKNTFCLALRSRYELNEIGFIEFITDLLLNASFDWNEDYIACINMMLEFIDEKGLSSLFGKSLETKYFKLLYLLLRNLPQQVNEELLVDLLEKAPTVKAFYTYWIADGDNYFKRCVQFVLATMSEETRSQITISNQTSMHLLANTHYDIIQELLESGLQWELTASETLLEDKQSIRLIKNLVFSCKLPDEMLTILAQRYQRAVCGAIAEENYIQRCDDVAMASDYYSQFCDFNRRGYRQNSAYAFMTWVDETQGGFINSLRKTFGMPKIHCADLVPSDHARKNARNNPYINLFSKPTEQSTSKKQQVLQPREELSYEYTCTSRFFTSVDESATNDDDMEKNACVLYENKLLLELTDIEQLIRLSRSKDHIGVIQYVSAQSILCEKSMHIIIGHIECSMQRYRELYNNDLSLIDVLIHALCKNLFNRIEKDPEYVSTRIRHMLAAFNKKPNHEPNEIILGYFDEILSKFGRDYMENFLKNVLDPDSFDSLQRTMKKCANNEPIYLGDRSFDTDSICKNILDSCRLSREVRDIVKAIFNKLQRGKAYSSLKH